MSRWPGDCPEGAGTSFGSSSAILTGTLLLHVIPSANLFNEWHDSWIQNSVLTKWQWQNLPHEKVACPWAHQESCSIIGRCHMDRLKPDLITDISQTYIPYSNAMMEQNDLGGIIWHHATERQNCRWGRSPTPLVTEACLLGWAVKHF